MKEKLLMMAASMLGFATACENKRTVDMYGTPYIDYRIKGKVTDKDGNPIKGIQVSGDHNKPTATDSDGSYELNGRGWPQKTELTFTDIDGPENGGEFAEKLIEIKFTEADRTDKGDKNWYSGAFVRTGVDAELEEKE